jgi:hypothetical protein
VIGDVLRKNVFDQVPLEIQQSRLSPGIKCESRTSARLREFRLGGTSIMTLGWVLHVLRLVGTDHLGRAQWTRTAKAQENGDQQAT